MSLTKSTTLLSYITISPLHFVFYSISSILHRPPCHYFTETVEPRTVLINKTHQQFPFTMVAIISSIWRPINSTWYYSIKYLSWITSISRGHNCVEHRFVLLFIQLECTEVMYFTVEYEFDSSVNNPSYKNSKDRTCLQILK
jgi:hypothetical protein